MPSGVYIRTKSMWSKGLTKETDERIRKISSGMNGKKNALGCKRSEKTKEKIRKSVKRHIMAHPEFRLNFQYWKGKHPKHMQGGNHSMCGVRRYGKDNPAWKGGVTPLIDSIRHLPEYNQWRSDIFQRDNWTCQECEARGGKLEAHHCEKSFVELFQEFLQEYDQFSPYEDKDTLVRLAMNWHPFWTAEGETLCRDCHKLTDNYARNYKE